MKPASALRLMIAMVALTALLSAQSRPGLGRGNMIPNSPADELKLDNAQVRVLLDTELPFETAAPRQHPRNRILIYLDDGHITQSSADGRVEDIQVEAGNIRWSRAGEPYLIENHSGHPIRIVEITLKTGANGGTPPPPTKLDPVEVDPQHYTLDFENPQVRVLRVHYGPHEKGVLHEHQLNRVVVYLNDQGNMIAGDVRVAGAATHTEENAGDAPADRIAVEIK